MNMADAERLHHTVDQVLKAGVAREKPKTVRRTAVDIGTLARAFDVPGTSFGLKEPQILNDVIGLQLRRGDPRQVAAALDIDPKLAWALRHPEIFSSAVDAICNDMSWLRA